MQNFAFYHDRRFSQRTTIHIKHFEVNTANPVSMTEESLPDAIYKLLVHMIDHSVCSTFVMHTASLIRNTSVDIIGTLPIRHPDKNAFPFGLSKFP